MSFTKITNSELNSRGATTLPNQPTISALALKQEFDAPAKNIVAPKFNNLIDELEASTSAGNIGAQAPAGRTGTTAQGVINSVSSDLATVEAQAHTHSNKSVIDKFDDNGTGLTYDGSPISGAVDSVNGYTGTVVLDASDVGALPDSTTIPTKTSDLNNDSGFVTSSDLDGKVDKVTGKGLSTNDYDDTAKGIVDGATAAIAAKSTVAWNQQVLTGQKIAIVTIDGTPTDVYAPTGGGGGGGAVDSVNGQTGTVVLGVNDINDVTITSIADQHTLVYNANSSIWENEALADVALTGAYSDLTGTPSTATSSANGLMSSTDKSKLDGIASGAEANVQSDWNQADSTADDFIKNKPTIPAAQIQSDWNQADSTAKDYIKNKPSVLGHNMLPTPDASVNESAVVSAINGGITEGGINDDVASLYGIGKWSNTMTKTYKIQGIAGSSTPITQSGIGNFDMTGVDQTGWVTIPALIGSGTDPYLDIKLGFDPATVSVPITLGGWVVDDSTGKMCIKFGNEITEADTHTALVTVEVIFKRTEVVSVS